MFVFRNNTIERFFPEGYSCSGYDDVSAIPDDADGYVWFYQAPIKFDNGLLADEIRACLQKFLFVLDKIDPKKTVVAFTMDLLYAMPLANSDYRVGEAIAQYNEGLVSAAKRQTNVKAIDLCEFTRQYPVKELMDWKFYFISQTGLNPKLAGEFKAWYAKKLDQLALRRKKCLVLDLDNTLWGGILGEDGAEGIKIGGDYPGNAFLCFQEALLELAKSGVILTVCSKNNEQDVLEVWEKHPHNILKKEHFSAYRIDWKDKATNIKELADELNLGLDSFVFVDDNPAERELVKQMLPEVAVPDFPSQPYELPLFVQSLAEDFFRVYAITDEDLKKTEQYKANAARTESQKQFVDFEAFLKSLDIRLTIESANELNIQRIAQMTQKTNQFNLTTKRYIDADIKSMLADRWKVYCVSVADRFGDSGITGCMMINGNEIDSFLMSCRVLGKGIEVAFIKSVLQLLKVEGMETIKARFIPTDKNTQIKDFYERCGFTCVLEDVTGGKEYVADLAKLDLTIKDYYQIKMK